MEEEALVFSRDIAFFILEAALVFSRNIVFFFLWARLRSSLETSFFLCRKWLRSSLRRRFFFKVGGGLRLNSEGAVRVLKYMNPGDKSIGAVSPDVTPAAPILSDVRPVPSHRPPPPPPPNPTFPQPFSEIPLPKILRETFFVHISSWSSRLDLPTGENSRGRRWLLESARVAPRSPEFTTHPRRFGGPRPPNFQAQKCFKTRRFFENHVP